MAGSTPGAAAGHTHMPCRLHRRCRSPRWMGRGLLQEGRPCASTGRHAAAAARQRAARRLRRAAFGVAAHALLQPPGPERRGLLEARRAADPHPAASESRAHTQRAPRRARRARQAAQLGVPALPSPVPARQA